MVCVAPSSAKRGWCSRWWLTENIVLLDMKDKCSEDHDSNVKSDACRPYRESNLHSPPQQYRQKYHARPTTAIHFCCVPILLIDPWMFHLPFANLTQELSNSQMHLRISQLMGEHENVCSIDIIVVLINELIKTFLVSSQQNLQLTFVHRLTSGYQLGFYLLTQKNVEEVHYLEPDNLSRWIFLFYCPIFLLVFFACLEIRKYFHNFLLTFSPCSGDPCLDSSFAKIVKLRKHQVIPLEIQ